MTRVKVTYVAMDSDGHKPIVTASTFKDLRAGLDDHYQVECLEWHPHNTKYPDDYEGYYEYAWKNIIQDEITTVIDKVKVYCVEYYPYTIYEV